MRQAIVQTFDAKDHAISDFNVLGFGAMTREMAADAGITDFCNREAFQAAIDAAFHNGGGVVYAPAGIYDFRTSVTGSRTERGVTHEFERVLSLHRSVQLRGEWDNRINDPSWQGTAADPLGGTILAVFAGAGTDNFQTYVDSDQVETQTGQPMAANVSDRFICMEEGTGVTNLSVWYPEQDLSASTTVTVRDAHGRKTGVQEAVQGITFPWTFVQRTGNSATIDNVTLVNAWNGFIAFPAELHYVVNTNMTALSHGIVVHTCTDIGRIENVNINPGFWARSGLPGAPSYGEIRDFTRAHGVGFRMHRSDWEYIYGLNISGYNIGMWIGREIVGTETPNGQIFNSHILDSVVALHIDGVNTYGFLISNSTFEGSTAAVYIDEYFNTSLQFNGVDFHGPIINNGSGQFGVLSFESSTFDYSGYNLQLNNRGVALITQCEFLQSNMHVSMSSTFDDVRVVNSGAGFNLSNIYAVSMDISGSGYSVTTSSEYIFPTIPQDIRTDIAVHPRPASTNVLRVDLPRATGFNNDPPTTDVSGLLQQALNFLATQGGGTLFLPGGRYLLSNPIVVPSGVELRGTWDVQHHTSGGGTAIFTDYGLGMPYSAPALISLSAGAGLRGITFTQHNLTAVTHTDQSGTPTFPFLVRGLGPNVHIINMTVHLGDNGIDLFTHDTSGHYVDYFGGTLLRRGIWVGGGARDGYIRNMQFNPHYTMRLPEGHQGFHIPSGNLFLFTQGFCSALMFGHVYNQTVFNNFVFGSVYGIHFRRDPITGQYPGTINIVGHGSDGCTFALYVQHAGPNTVINAINSELVNTSIPTQPVRTYVRMGGPSVSHPSEDWSIHPEAQLNLFNSAFWGSPTTGAQIFGGVVRFQQANFSQLPAIGIDVFGGRAHVYSSRFAPQRTTGDPNSLYARLGAEVEGLELIADGLELTNNFYRSGIAGNVTSAIPFGLFGADIDGEPFEFTMDMTGGNPRLRIEYIVRGQSLPGTVRLVSPAHLAADFTPVPFAPISEGQHIFIDFPNYSVHSIGLEIVLENGTIFEFSAMIDRGYMERATAGEGNPAARSALPPLVKDSFHYVTENSGPLSWTGPQDLSSVSRFAFSDTHLYAYIVVRNRQHHNTQTGGNIWNGDSLQLGVDLLNITNGSNNDPRRNELGFALNSNDASIQRYRWSGSPGAASIDGMTVNVTRDEAAGTTTYDLVIPTETVVDPAALGGLLSDLDRIGVSVFVNDAVNGARAQELEVMPGHLKNPTLFTSLYLMDEGEYDAMIVDSARDMLDAALADMDDAAVATALNFIALVRDPEVREAMEAELDPFVQVGVSAIVGVPAAGYANVPLTLTGTVVPSDATAQTIVWSLVNAGTTGATLSGNVLTATAGGNVTVRATVVGGGSLVGTDFWHDFVIAIDPPPLPDRFALAVRGSHAELSGAGNFLAGETVYVNAGTRAGYTFTGWITDDNVDFASPAAVATSFVMPARNVTVTATWQANVVDIVDRTQLQAAVNQGVNRVEANYTPASWTAFAQALANAQAVLVNQDATQGEVDAARTALQSAMAALAAVGGQPPATPPVVTPPAPPPPTEATPSLPPLPYIPWAPRDPQQTQDATPTDGAPYEVPTDDTGLPPVAGHANRLVFTAGNLAYQLNSQLHTAVGAPFIDPATDRMMIPLRTVAEATGVRVEWDDVTRSAIIHLPTGALTLPVDAPLPGGMGMPLMVNDRVFVPLRFVMDAMGKTVEWDAEHKAGIILW